MKLSVVLATRNEEENIARCLNSVKEIADEVIVFDEHSIDKTVAIAKELGARVFSVNHEEIFHVTKQKAIDKAQGDWILQLDADEVVTPALRKEILSVLSMSSDEILRRTPKDARRSRLFSRHLSLLQSRDGELGERDREIVAFLIPRINMFLGKPLIYGGVYPDGVVRLIKRGKARLPAKSVHEQMQIDGSVAWLFEPLEHWDSPTIKRYLERLNRYTDLSAQDLSNEGVPRNAITLFRYITLEPLKAFLLRYVRHKGFKDGMRGFLWAAFSAWHYPIAYSKYFFNTKV